MSETWYVMRDGKKSGPIDGVAFRNLVAQGQIHDGDGVWTEGLPGWVPLAQVRPRLSPPAEADMLSALGLESGSGAVAMGEERPRQVAPVSYPMGVGDRIARALFVGLAVGLAWGIRGDFGHLIGAMYPGAILMLALAYVSGQDSALRSMPALAMASALGIGLGGNMSYGLLHGYAQADTFRNYSYGFLTLILQGGSWGFFGGALVGMILERDRAKWVDWAGGIGVMAGGGLFLYGVVYKVFGFDINPYRSNDALAHLGGAIGLFIWLACRKLPIATRASMLGFVGFGLGMAGGRLMGNIFQNLEGFFTTNHWNVMEMGCGMIGGFVFAFGMLGVPFRERKSALNLTVSDVIGAVFVLGLIPLLHRLTRIKPDKVTEWGRSLQEYGSSWTSDSILMALNVVVALALVGVVVWLVLQKLDLERWHAFPVLWLSLLMVLFQNFRALYFFAPGKEGHWSTHGFYWILLLAMVGYVIVREAMEGHSDECDSEEETDKVPWIPWSATLVGGFLVILGLASMINGDSTMRFACTRWPVWSWRDGPFPYE